MPLTEREAVAIVTGFDTTHPQYQQAVEVAFFRRGTRDAIIATIARQDSWQQAIVALHGLRGSTDMCNANIDAVYAAAHYIDGSTAFAAAVARRYPGNTMMDLMLKLIDQGHPGAQWGKRMADIDLERCYTFTQ